MCSCAASPQGEFSGAAASPCCVCVCVCFQLIFNGFDQDYRCVCLCQICITSNPQTGLYEYVGKQTWTHTHICCPFCWWTRRIFIFYILTSLRIKCLNLILSVHREQRKVKSFSLITRPRRCLGFFLVLTTGTTLTSNLTGHVQKMTSFTTEWLNINNRI